MSDVISAAQLPWASSPLARQVRLSAAVVLQAAQTIAGQRVLDEPHLPFTESEMPCIGVSSAESRQTDSGAGTAVWLRNKLSIYVELYVVAAAPADAVAQIDVLEAQVLGALLRDPYWPYMFGPLVSVNTKREWEDSERFIMHSMIEIVGNGTREKYATLLTSPLTANGAPRSPPLPVSIAAPLQTITTTITNTAGGTLTVDTNTPQS
jgi:hypothetical protein